jgi:hypothetical protein
MFAPQTGNPSFGVVRVLAKDSNDVGRNNNSLTFIDSDGQVKTLCKQQPTALSVCHSSSACHDHSGHPCLDTCASALLGGAWCHADMTAHLRNGGDVASKASMCWMQVGNAQGHNISESTANVVEDDRWHMVSGSAAADCMHDDHAWLRLDGMLCQLLRILVPTAAHCLSMSWHPVCLVQSAQP